MPFTMTNFASVGSPLALQFSNRRAQFSGLLISFYADSCSRGISFMPSEKSSSALSSPLLFAFVNTRLPR